MSLCPPRFSRTTGSNSSDLIGMANKSGLFPITMNVHGTAILFLIAPQCNRRPSKNMSHDCNMMPQSLLPVDATPAHSVFYYISKASNCTFRSAIGNDEYYRRGSFETDFADEQRTANIIRRCCLNCGRLLHIIRMEEEKHRMSLRWQNASSDFNVKRKGSSQRRLLLSQISGGTILHSLLQFYNHHCPDLVFSILLNTHCNATGSNNNMDTYSLPGMMMLLHRDHGGNLPIHIVASNRSISNDTFRFLLHHTLIAHQRQQLLGRQRNLSIGLFVQLCDYPTITELSYDHHRPPYILSRNSFGRTLLDTIVEQYIFHGNYNIIHSDDDDDKLRTNHYCSFDWQRYRGSVRHAVDQTIRKESNSHCSERDVGYGDDIPIHLIQRIKVVIYAAHNELILLQQFHGDHCIGCDKVRRSCCSRCLCYHARRSCNSQQVNRLLPIEEDEKYILHFASALTGPINFIYTQYKTSSVETKSVNSFLLQVDRSILDLLRYHCGNGAVRIRHPITGQVPLHHAVQSHCFLVRPGHNICYGSCVKNTNEEFKQRINYNDDWLQWIRTLLHIYPEACMIKNRQGYIPLHYAILQTCDDCDCHSGAHNKTDEYCRAISLSRYRIIQALILAYPPSIEISCPIRCDCNSCNRCEAVQQPRLRSRSDLTVENNDITTPNPVYNYEVYQIAAMMYHPPYNNNFDMLLTIIYSLLRMSPSRLFVLED